MPQRASTPVPEKAAAILDAALELFSGRGYGNTPVPLVAQSAGVAAGTIYRYFPGKQGVVNALYRRWKARLAAALLDDLATRGAARDVFADIWKRLAGFAVAHPEAFLFLETHHHAAYLDSASKKVGEQLDRAFAELVRGWQTRGETRAGDPDTLVALAYGGFVGVVRRRIERGQSLTHRVYDDTIDAAWAIFAGPMRG